MEADFQARREVARQHFEEGDALESFHILGNCGLLEPKVPTGCEIEDPLAVEVSAALHLSQRSILASLPGHWLVDRIVPFPSDEDSLCSARHLHEALTHRFPVSSVRPCGDCSEAQLKRVAELPYLTGISLQNTSIEARWLSHFPELKGLVLPQAVSSDGEWAGYLRGLTRLQSLEWWFAELGEADLHTISQMHQLRKLNLFEIRIPPGASWGGVLGGLVHLEELVLVPNSLDDDQMGFIERLTQLRWLDIRGGSFGREGFRALGALENLDTLHLSCPRLEAGELEELSGLKRLRMWSLSCDDTLTEEGFGDLTLGGLQTFYLSRARASSALLGSFGTRFPALECLALGETMTAPQALLSLHTAPRLRELSFSEPDDDYGGTNTYRRSEEDTATFVRRAVSDITGSG